MELETSVPSFLPQANIKIYNTISVISPSFGCTTTPIRKVPEPIIVTKTLAERESLLPAFTVASEIV